MKTPKFEIQRHITNGKVSIELIIWNSTYSEELHEMACKAGYELTTDITGRRSIMCSTPAEVDEARNPVIKFFDAKGECK